jgi:threonine/homoserine/homoserine lactone efflux protein
MYSSAFVFGVLAGLSIIEIALLIVNLALTHGTRPAVLAGIGAALGDLVWGTAALLSGSALSDVFVGREICFKPLCSVMVLGMGAWMLRNAVRPLKAAAIPDPRKARRAIHRYGPLLGTFALTCANPLMAVAFVGFLPPRIVGPVSIADACGLG